LFKKLSGFCSEEFFEPQEDFQRAKVGSRKWVRRPPFTTLAELISEKSSKGSTLFGEKEICKSPGQTGLYFLSLATLKGSIIPKISCENFSKYTGLCTSLYTREKKKVHSYTILKKFFPKFLDMILCFKVPPERKYIPRGVCTLFFPIFKKEKVSLMEETWAKIYDFTDYSVSTLGRIRNDRRDRLIRQSMSTRGVAKVGLYRDGIQYTRSVKVIVAETFVGGRTEKFDTAMLLDGDPFNNRVDNLVWRPRWFCWKYASQFLLFDKYVDKGPISDRKTEEVYDNVVQAAMINGLLVREIMISLVNKTPVFPTWQVFDWVR
jgi:hypothetical protein